MTVRAGARRPRPATAEAARSSSRPSTPPDEFTTVTLRDGSDRDGVEQSTSIARREFTATVSVTTTSTVTPRVPYQRRTGRRRAPVSRCRDGAIRASPAIQRRRPRVRLTFDARQAENRARLRAPAPTPSAGVDTHAVDTATRRSSSASPPAHSRAATSARLPPTTTAADATLFIAATPHLGKCNPRLEFSTPFTSRRQRRPCRPAAAQLHLRNTQPAPRTPARRSVYG